MWASSSPFDRGSRLGGVDCAPHQRRTAPHQDRPPPPSRPLGAVRVPRRRGRRRRRPARHRRGHRLPLHLRTSPGAGRRPGGAAPLRGRLPGPAALHAQHPVRHVAGDGPVGRGLQCARCRRQRTPESPQTPGGGRQRAGRPVADRHREVRPRSPRSPRLRHRQRALRRRTRSAHQDHALPRKEAGSCAGRGLTGHPCAGSRRADPPGPATRLLDLQPIPVDGILATARTGHRPGSGGAGLALAPLLRPRVRGRPQVVDGLGDRPGAPGTGNSRGGRGTARQRRHGLDRAAGLRTRSGARALGRVAART